MSAFRLLPVSKSYFKISHAGSKVGFAVKIEAGWKATLEDAGFKIEATGSTAEGAFIAAARAINEAIAQRAGYASAAEARAAQARRRAEIRNDVRAALTPGSGVDIFALFDKYGL